MKVLREGKPESRLLTLLAVFVIAGITSLTMTLHAQAQEKTGNNMDIYGIYLSANHEGDATLVESNGEFLLMDMGKAEDNRKILNMLKEREASEISLYISHYHIDHYGGSAESVTTGLENLINKGIYIKTLYLPDPTLASATEETDTRRCRRLTDVVLAQEPRNGVEPSVIQLKKGSKFKFGAVSAEVLGPLKGVTMKQCGSQEGRYMNNHSLVTMLTCGKTKFFTAGDIHEEQEKLLIKQYGSRLKADIMKLSHHGTSSSNTEAFLKCVRPMYSYGQDTNHTGLTASKHQESFVVKELVAEYGICYMTGEEGKTIHIKVADDKVTLYRYTANRNVKMTGWVTIKGGDGTNYKVDKYYLDADGRPLTGVQKIDGKYYYMGNGGLMNRGRYDSSGKYFVMRNYEDGSRCIYKDGHIAVGLTDVNDHLYYFDKKTGYRVSTKKSVELKKFDGKYYAMLKGGILYTGSGKGGFRAFPKGSRYFNSKGVMQTGWIKNRGYKYYLDKKTGYRVTGIQVIGGNTYYFNSTGKCMKQIDMDAVKKVQASGRPGGIFLTWKANKNVKGYEVWVSTKEGSSYVRKAQINNSATANCTVEGLKAKKTYYVKVRTFTKVSGNTVWGEFSRPVKVKVK